MAAPRTRNRPARGAYPAETRERAVTLYADVGLAAAHAELGIPKPTIKRWADAAGIDAAEVTRRNREQTAAAADSAAATRRKAVEDILERSTVKLAAIVDKALDATIAGLNGGTVPGQAGTHPALGWANPAQLVGVWTRALHDLQLLRGKDTGQPEGHGLTVIFAVPAPTAAIGAPGPVIIDLAPEDVDDEDTD